MCCLRDISRSRSLLQPEESRPGPAGAGNLAGHLAQGRIGVAPVHEGPLRCCSDLVGLPLPFAQEPGARFDPVLDPDARMRWLRRSRTEARELHTCGSGEAAKALLLNAIGDRQDEQLAA